MTDHGELTDEGTRLLDPGAGRRHRVRAAGRTYEAQAYQPLVDQVAAATTRAAPAGQNAGATMPGSGLVRPDHRGRGHRRHDLHAPDPQNLPRTAAGGPLLSVLIAFLLFLIWDFDAPFGRGISATAEPFHALFPGLGG